MDRLLFIPQGGKSKQAFTVLPDLLSFSAQRRGNLPWKLVRALLLAPEHPTAVTSAAGLSASHPPAGREQPAGYF